MSFIFKVSPFVDHQIRTAAAWWLEHRTKAPGRFVEDLEAALNLLEEFPHIGEPIPHPRIVGLRRILLARIRYHLYYVPLVEQQEINILAVWHTSRRRLPPL